MKLIDKAFDPDDRKFAARVIRGIQFREGEAELPDTEDGIKRAKAIAKSYNVEIIGAPIMQEARLVPSDIIEGETMTPSVTGDESPDNEDDED